MKTLLAQLILLLALSTSGSMENYTFLQFVKLPYSSPKVMQFFKKKAFDWYAGWPTKLLLELFYPRQFSIKLDCSVEALKHGDRLNGMSFCFYLKNNLYAPQCFSINFTSKHSKRRLNRQLEVLLKLDPYTGGIVYIKNVNIEVDASLVFSCGAQNYREEIRSNVIEIADYRNQHRHEYFVTNEPKHRLNRNGPSTIPCSNRSHVDHWNVVRTYTPFYTWFYSRHGIIHQTTHHTLQWTNDSAVQILPDGSLYFPFITTKINKQINHRYLFCRKDGYLHRMLLRPIEFTDAPLETQTDTLTITQPPPGGMRINLMNDSSLIVLYYCNFKVGRGKVSVRWIKYDRFGFDAPSTVIGTEFNPIFRVQSINFYGLKFIGPFNAATKGMYTCEVSWTPIIGPTITKTASYYISISNFPQVSPDVPRVVFVYPRSNGTVECKFQQPVEIKLLLNGNQVELRNQAKLQESVNHIILRTNAEWRKRRGLSSLRALMTPLNVTVSPFRPHRRFSIRYTAINMQDVDPISKATSSHRVTCYGENKVTYVRRSFLLLVVPMIKMLRERGRNVPARCSKDNEARVFRCIIANIEQYRHLDYEVRVKQYWRLGGMYLDKQNFDISNDNATLKISKQDITRFVSILLHSSNERITCVITMEYPPELQQPNDLLPGTFNTKVFYHSDHDTKMVKELTYECDFG